MLYDSTKRSIAEYQARTYKKVLFQLRLDDDADMIEDWQLAKENGLKSREWVRMMFDAYQEKQREEGTK